MTARSLLFLVLAMNLMVTSSCNREEERRGEKLNGWWNSEGVNATESVATDPTHFPPNLESTLPPSPQVNIDTESTGSAGDTASSPTPNPIEPVLDELDKILLEIDVVLGSEAAWQVDLP